MRTLLISTLSLAVAGCSCLAPSPQASLEGFTKTASAGPPTELKPAPFTPIPEPPKVKSSTTTKPAKPTSVAAKPAKPSTQVSPAKPAEEKAAPPAIVKPEVGSDQPKSAPPTTKKPEPPAPAAPSDTSDPVLKKAKTTVSAKMENPASAEFDDMKRAMRKNTFGQPVDTICGHVKGKKASGEATGERPFLYLVKEDEAYVVDGNAESAAAAAYRNICVTLDARGKDARQQPRE
jgi:hypothetical protein